MDNVSSRWCVNWDLSSGHLGSLRLAKVVINVDPSEIEAFELSTIRIDVKN